MIALQSVQLLCLLACSPCHHVENLLNVMRVLGALDGSSRSRPSLLLHSEAGVDHLSVHSLRLNLERVLVQTDPLACAARHCSLHHGKKVLLPSVS